MENSLLWKTLFERNCNFTYDVIESIGATPDLPTQISQTSAER